MDDIDKQSMTWEERVQWRIRNGPFPDEDPEEDKRKRERWLLGAQGLLPEQRRKNADRD